MNVLGIYIYTVYAFYIGKMGQMLSNRMSGHWFTCTIVNYDNPGPSASYKNFLTMSAINFK